MPKKQQKVYVNLSEIEGSEEECYVPPYRIVNVVSTCNLGNDKIDLRSLALKYKFLEFDPDVFAAATMRIRDPATTALLFQSGNMVITGASDTKLSRLAARKYVSVLLGCGLDVKFSGFAIQNIVATVNVGFTIDLMKIKKKHSLSASYEPEMFPGLIFRTNAPQLVFSLFRSGTMNVTGGKTVEQIAVTYTQLYKKVIRHFRAEDGASASSSEYRNKLALQNLKDYNNL